MLFCKKKKKKKSEKGSWKGFMNMDFLSIQSDLNHKSPGKVFHVVRKSVPNHAGSIVLKEGKEEEYRCRNNKREET